MLELAVTLDAGLNKIAAKPCSAHLDSPRFGLGAWQQRGCGGLRVRMSHRDLGDAMMQRPISESTNTAIILATSMTRVD